MGKTYDAIDARLRTFIEEQPVFFVATAPLADEGHINLSPKGTKGSLVVIDDETVAYLDLTGSHAETVAHLRENSRITLMWCAFDGPPKVVRLHGRGEPVFRDDARWPDLLHLFPAADAPAIRAIVVVNARRISDSCGFSIPCMDYRSERTLLTEFFERRSEEEHAAYCEQKNGASIDGMPAIPLPLPVLPLPVVLGAPTTA